MRAQLSLCFCIKVFFFSFFSSFSIVSLLMASVVRSGCFVVLCVLAMESWSSSPKRETIYFQKITQLEILLSMNASQAHTSSDPMVWCHWPRDIQCSCSFLCISVAHPLFVHWNHHCVMHECSEFLLTFWILKLLHVRTICAMFFPIK